MAISQRSLQASRTTSLWSAVVELLHREKQYIAAFSDDFQHSDAVRYERITDRVELSKARTARGRTWALDRPRCKGPPHCLRRHLSGHVASHRHRMEDPLGIVRGAYVCRSCGLLGISRNCAGKVDASTSHLQEFLIRCLPSCVSTLSGWNCTPSTGCLRWRSPMMMPSSVRAVISNSRGRSSSATIRSDSGCRSSGLQCRRRASGHRG